MPDAKKTLVPGELATLDIDAILALEATILVAEAALKALREKLAEMRNAGER